MTTAAGMIDYQLLHQATLYALGARGTLDSLGISDQRGAQLRAVLDEARQGDPSRFDRSPSLREAAYRIVVEGRFCSGLLTAPATLRALRRSLVSAGPAGAKIPILPADSPLRRFEPSQSVSVWAKERWNEGTVVNLIHDGDRVLVRTRRRVHNGPYGNGHWLVVGPGSLGLDPRDPKTLLGRLREPPHDVKRAARLAIESHNRR